MIENNVASPRKRKLLYFCIRIHLWRGAYTAEGFKIERVKGQQTFPLTSAREIDVGIAWKDLIHRVVRMKLEIGDLKINIVQEVEEGEKKVAVGRDSLEGKKAEAADWKTTFKNLVPIDVNRLRVSGDSIHFRDLTSSPQVDPQERADAHLRPADRAQARALGGSEGRQKIKVSAYFVMPGALEAKASSVVGSTSTGRPPGTMSALTLSGVSGT
jgi:hypothetical protein